MPLPAYMTIKGTRQGLISAGALGEESVGAGWQQDHQDQILVQAINHGIAVPAGAQNNKRMHRPLIITKAIDKSSPLLNNALSNGEPLTTCRIEIYRPTGQGGNQHFYTVEINDAVIIGIDFIMPNCLESNAQQYTQLEKIHFAYQTINWRHEIAGTLGYDEWIDESQF